MQTIKEQVITNGSTGIADWMGGSGTFFASGSFTGGVLNLEFSIDGGVVWLPIKNSLDAAVVLSAGGEANFDLAPCKMRVRMGGSTVQAGTCQVSTLTASGSTPIGVGGVVSVTVTSALFSPAKVFNVMLDKGMTQAQWMDRIFQQLNASAEMAGFFAVGHPSDAVITLTTLAPGVANDTTLNIVLALGSVTNAGCTSASTTSGVAAAPNVLVAVRRSASAFIAATTAAVSTLTFDPATASIDDVIHVLDTLINAFKTRSIS